MNLNVLRREIDRIDLNLLRLLNRRADVARKIGRLKKRHGLPVQDRKREQAVLARMLQRNGGPLPQESVRGIFREVLRQNRRLQGQAGAMTPRKDC